MDSSIEKLLNEDTLIPIVAIVCGCMVAMTAIIFTSVRAIAVGRAREQTKRELAAYVAEGTLDPEKAVSMINAGRSPGDSPKASKGCCA